jgi:hypothetical protein
MTVLHGVPMLRWVALFRTSNLVIPCMHGCESLYFAALVFFFTVAGQGFCAARASLFYWKHHF